MKAEASSVLDPRARAVADRLHARGDRQMGAVIRHYLPKLPRLLAGGPIGTPDDPEFFKDKLLPLGRAQAELLYMLARAARATCAVEFGTSFGVSTLYLAAAVRDAGAGGRVIGTEIVPEKARAARDNIEAAGLTPHVEIREGDARETLRRLDEPVDLLLLDGWPVLAREILDLIEPRLAPGSVIVVDNVGQFPVDTRAVVDRLGDPDLYRMSRLPLRGGTLVAVYDRGATNRSI
jgi:predicted O-methyltransferase YrrM